MQRIALHQRHQPQTMKQSSTSSRLHNSRNNRRPNLHSPKQCYRKWENLWKMSSNRYGQFVDCELKTGAPCRSVTAYALSAALHCIAFALIRSDFMIVAHIQVNGAGHPRKRKFRSNAVIFICWFDSILSRRQQHIIIIIMIIWMNDVN